jgi:hypothetical protein
MSFNFQTALADMNMQNQIQQSVHFECQTISEKYPKTGARKI